MTGAGGVSRAVRIAVRIEGRGRRSDDEVDSFLWLPFVATDVAAAPRCPHSQPPRRPHSRCSPPGPHSVAAGPQLFLIVAAAPQALTVAAAPQAPSQLSPSSRCSLMGLAAPLHS